MSSSLLHQRRDHYSVAVQFACMNGYGIGPVPITMILSEILCVVVGEEKNVAQHPVSEERTIVEYSKNWVYGS